MKRRYFVTKSLDYCWILFVGRLVLSSEILILVEKGLWKYSNGVENWHRKLSLMLKRDYLVLKGMDLGLNLDARSIIWNFQGLTFCWRRALEVLLPCWRLDWTSSQCTMARNQLKVAKTPNFHLYDIRKFLLFQVSIYHDSSKNICLIFLNII